MSSPDDDKATIAALRARIAELEARLGKDVPSVGCTLCPNCGERGQPFTDRGNDTIYPRRGCLRCNQWWEPVRLRRP